MNTVQATPERRAGIDPVNIALADALAASLHVPALLWAGWALGRGAGSLPEAPAWVGWIGVGLAGAALAMHLAGRVRAGRGAARGKPAGPSALPAAAAGEARRA